MTSVKDQFVETFDEITTVAKQMKRFGRKVGALLGFTALNLLYGCGDKGNDPAPINNGGTGTTTVKVINSKKTISVNSVDATYVILTKESGEKIGTFVSLSSKSQENGNISVVGSQNTATVDVVGVDLDNLNAISEDRITQFSSDGKKATIVLKPIDQDGDNKITGAEAIKYNGEELAELSIETNSIVYDRTPTVSGEIQSAKTIFSNLQQVYKKNANLIYTVSGAKFDKTGFTIQ